MVKEQWTRVWMVGSSDLGSSGGERNERIDENRCRLIVSPGQYLGNSGEGARVDSSNLGNNGGGAVAVVGGVRRRGGSGVMMTAAN